MASSSFGSPTSPIPYFPPSMADVDIFEGLNIPASRAHSASFAIDSQENLYIAVDKNSNVTSNHGSWQHRDLFTLPRGATKAHLLLPDSALHGSHIEEVIDIQISQVDSADVRRAFALVSSTAAANPAHQPAAAPIPSVPHESPSQVPSAAPTTTGPLECMWILGSRFLFPRLALLDLRSQKLITVVAASRDAQSRDGYAAIAPRSSSRTLPLAAFHHAKSFALVNSSVVVYEQQDSLKEIAALRLLNLDNWRVTTICIAHSHVPSNPKLFALPNDHLTNSSAASEVVIMIDRLSFAVSHVNLVSGEFAPGGFGPSHEECRIPVVSSSIVPFWLNYNPQKRVSLQRAFLGQFQTLLELPRRAFAAHVASTGLVIAATANQYQHYYLPRRLPEGARLPSFDVSDLIDNASIVSQELIEVHNRANNRSWSLYFDLLKDLHPSLKLERLKIVIHLSPLPLASIDALICFLHQKSPHMGDWIQSCRTWSHVVYLWREIGLSSNDAISTFASTFIPQLPADESCAALIDIWNDTQTSWTRTDPIMQYLMSHVAKHCAQQFKLLVDSQPSDRNIMLRLNVAEFEEDHVALPAFEDVRHGLTMVSLRWSDLPYPPSPKSLLSRTEDFVFSLSVPNDQSIAAVADSRYMYPRWGWFKRLMTTGSGFEKTSRTAVMPNFMSPNMLMAILECVHGQLDTLVSEEDAVTLLEHRLEFDLVDSNDVPFPPFDQLVRYCMDVSFPKITEDNCISQLERYYRIQLSAKVEEVLNFIVASDPVLRASALPTLPLELIGQLQMKYRGR